MWSRFKQFLKGDQRPVVSRIDNAVLGTLNYSEDDECWVTDEHSSHLPFQFFIAGNADMRIAQIAPNEALVRHAESVALEPQRFLDAVAQLLVQEMADHRSLRYWAEEVSQLQVSALHLAWPHRPDDGMVEFDGPDEFRLWRCGYVKRMPVGPLGFDS